MELDSLLKNLRRPHTADHGFWDPDRQLRGLPGKGRSVAAVLAATVHKDGVGCFGQLLGWLQQKKRHHRKVYLVGELEHSHCA